MEHNAPWCDHQRVEIESSPSLEDQPDSDINHDDIVQCYGDKADDGTKLGKRTLDSYTDLC